MLLILKFKNFLNFFHTVLQFFVMTITAKNQSEVCKKLIFQKKRIKLNFQVHFQKKGKRFSNPPRHFFVSKYHSKKKKYHFIKNSISYLYYDFI